MSGYADVLLHEVRWEAEGDRYSAVVDVDGKRQRWPVSREDFAMAQAEIRAAQTERNSMLIVDRIEPVIPPRVQLPRPDHVLPLP